MLFRSSVFLYSCSFDESKNNFFGGELLDDEKISELKEELLSENGTDEREEATSKNEEKGDETDKEYQTVFWTEQGKVWHSVKDCYHLKNVPYIFSGTVEEAKNVGKQTACANCCK